MDSIKQRITKMLCQSTLDEKLAQFGLYWMYDVQTNGELDQKKTSDKLKYGIGQITPFASASTLDFANTDMEWRPSGPILLQRSVS